MIDRNDTVVRYRSSVGGSLAPADGVHRPRLMSAYRRRLVVTDVLLLAAAIALGLLISSRQSAWAISPVFAVYGIPPVIGLLWWAAPCPAWVLRPARYRPGHRGDPPDRVGNVAHVRGRGRSELPDPSGHLARVRVRVAPPRTDPARRRPLRVARVAVPTARIRAASCNARSSSAATRQRPNWWIASRRTPTPATRWWAAMPRRPPGFPSGSTAWTCLLQATDAGALALVPSEALTSQAIHELGVAHRGARPRPADRASGPRHRRSPAHGSAGGRPAAAAPRRGRAVSSQGLRQGQSRRGRRAGPVDPAATSVRRLRSRRAVLRRGDRSSSARPASVPAAGPSPC